LGEPPALPGATPPTTPADFVNGRYTVKRFLGEGGKKQVYLARDTTLARDVAFALIKTEGLDAVGRQRIIREGQAMGTLGAHPHIVTVFDLGEEQGQPYMVTELMQGGDVEGLIEKAPEHKLSLAQALQIAEQVCEGLEFAHSKGIIHRDLKPGNVWLAGDGTAKIGDFGLAIAVGRTRLTQAGMMVGTVSYMPPEQATGSEVTPRSDLYSLGAMLYEMVTGRPPFLGEDSVAIIGQHLNTSPIAPSWHQPDCPPGLEALILRLLEKDPSKRPASAAEVRAALASVQAVVAQAATSAESALVGGAAAAQATVAMPDNPLYRRVFVGRESELKQLQAAFDAALSGQGSLAMVVGEPGIGKTSVCEQLATYVALRGGRVLVGHCYEEGSLSLPYLPFVEAIRSYVLEREPDGLKADLGSAGLEVARIVSEIRDRVPVDLPPPGDPEEDRWRLLHAVIAFLRNATAVQPLLLVLEDLHDADGGTLDLLVHLAHNLGGCRLLIAGTYRDVEVDRSHPLSGALAELRRSSGLLRVPLRGLTVDEVHRMYETVRGQPVPWAQAELVHRQTEGNPLFIQEVLRYLVEEGIVIREGGRYVRADDRPADSLIPEGLRDVVGKRLSRLSPQANQALGVAAVIGREFRLDVLQQVAGMGEEELYAALEEATGRAIVEQHQALGTVAFRFTHAFFRQTLYEELFIPRRIRLHQQVGRALEAVYGRRLEEHAAELAEHFIQSTEAGDLEKARQYNELAAARAMSVFAYGEAARHCEQALRTQEVLDPDDKRKRCELLLALGEALVPTAESLRVEDVAEEAFALAEELSDSHLAFRACDTASRLSVLGGVRAPGFGDSESSQYRRKWAERIDRSAADGTAERVRAEKYLYDFASMDRGDVAESRRHQTRALEVALRLDDSAEIAQVASSIFAAGAPPPERHEERRQLAERLRGRSFAEVSPGRLVFFLTSWGWTQLTWGDRAGAEVLFRRAAEAAERSRDGQVAVLPIATQALIHTLDGNLEAALAAGERIRALGAELGREQAARQVTGQATRRALLYLGRPEEALPDIFDPPTLFLAWGVYAAQRAIFLAHAGRTDEARRILDGFKGERDFAFPGDESPVNVLHLLLEAATVVGDRELAGVLLRRFAPLAGLIITELSMAHCIGRLCGDAAVLLDQPEEARGFYDQALVACERIRFRPELALTHLAIAELLLGTTGNGQQAAGEESEGPPVSLTGEIRGRGAIDRARDARAEAMQHLDIAIAELREMKMQPFLERALRHKEVLKA
jgi:hypothetical protein